MGICSVLEEVRLRLSDGFDALNLRNPLAKSPLNPDPERHIGRWATYTCAVHSNLNHALIRDIDKLDVTTIGLHCWTDEIQHSGDAFVQWSCLSTHTES